MSEKQAKRLRRLEKAVDGLSAQVNKLEENREFTERLLNRAYAGRKAERQRAEAYKTDLAAWKTVALATVCAAMVVVLAATAVNAKGDAAEDAAEPPAVLQTAQAAPEEAENERIEAALLARAHKMENCKVTYYDCCVKCCGKADGITATGVQAVPYVTCAVDPAIIPFGALVLVDFGDGELHYYRADDAGVTGNHIDICVSGHAEALELGVTRATVYWTED